MTVEETRGRVELQLFPGLPFILARRTESPRKVRCMTERDPQRPCFPFHGRLPSLYRCSIIVQNPSEGWPTMTKADLRDLIARVNAPWEEGGHHQRRYYQLESPPGDGDHHRPGDPFAAPGACCRTEEQKNRPEGSPASHLLHLRQSVGTSLYPRRLHFPLGASGH